MSPRQDRSATVPPVEFTSYYGRNVVHPAPWGHEIPAYIFLGGLAGGSGVVAAGAHLAGLRLLRRNARATALGAIGLGSVALVKDLGRPERSLNMMRTVKLTSPMSVGSWILAGFGSFTGAAAIAEVVAPMLPEGSRAAKALVVADPLASAGSAFFAPPLAAYTAVLLSDTATPLWHESYRELPFVFVSSALGAGAGAAMVTTPPAETGPVRAVAALAAASDLTADALLTRRLGEMGEPLHHGKARRLHTAARVLTAAGGIGSLLARRSRVAGALSGLALVAGSVCTRFAVFEAGMESAEDPRWTIQPQRARADRAAAQGRGATQPGGAWPT
ncbi:NrfD/PsrC family molybdoenzyme membrane anchor subunit [Actinomycetota bacterium]